MKKRMDSRIKNYHPFVFSSMMCLKFVSQKNTSFTDSLGQVQRSLNACSPQPSSMLCFRGQYGTANIPSKSSKLFAYQSSLSDSSSSPSAKKPKEFAFFTEGEEETKTVQNQNEANKTSTTSEVFNNKLKIVTTEYSLESFQRSNQDTSLTHKPAVFEGSWVQSGDLLTDCASSVGGELSLGQNILVAYMPWEGYNFEDAILISERLVIDDLYTSVHIERYDVETYETKLGFEQITRDIPDVSEKEIEHLDSFGIVKMGAWVEEGDILVGKVTPINKKTISSYQKLLYTILEKQIRPIRDSSLRAPKGIKAKVIDIKYFLRQSVSGRALSSSSLSSPSLPLVKKSVNMKEANKSETNKKLISSQKEKRQVLDSRSFGDDSAVTQETMLNNLSKHERFFESQNFIKKMNRTFLRKMAIFPLEKLINIGNKDQKTDLSKKNKYNFLRYYFLRKSHYSSFKKFGLSGASASSVTDLSLPRSGTPKVKRSGTPKVKRSGTPSVKQRKVVTATQPKRSEPRGFRKAVEAQTGSGRATRLLALLNTNKEGHQLERNNKSLIQVNQRKDNGFFNRALSSPLPLCGTPSVKKTMNKEQKSLMQKTNTLQKIETIHIYLAEKRKVQVGDKMAGRHGNKGIVSQILPIQDMPYLPDGTPLDMVLNPLGVPSRMNVGQIYECLLGLAGKFLGENYKVFSFDESYGPEASRSFVFNKLYEARNKTGFKWLFDPNSPGKIRLYDGRTGDSFDQKVTVGQAYMLRLVHMVDDKIHMRSTGPYSLVTQQPLRGRSKQGGQRLGEMEVWAIEGYGAAFTLLEMLTIKSDDMTGRMTLWSNLILNKDISIGTPESFKVLICELQALCLDIGLFRYNENTNQKNNKKSLREITSLINLP